ncbi:DMT family transporter [Leucobacter komagatae]|uniref:DMT family transporter n=1 Tax=Leucobacter komagatae TaxID=55969 RepID=UPI0005AD10A0|nr:DMT family transporter [Leucobacter komagatae]
MIQRRKAPGTAIAFGVLALIWGSSFFLIKLSLEGLSPGQVALGRLAFGALTLVVIMLVTKRAWPRSRRVWLHMTVVAATLCTIPFTLFAWAETMVPSTVASIVNATTPIMTLLLIPLVMPKDRLSRAQTIGLVVGILGVVVLVGPWRMVLTGDGISLPGVLAALGATACYGFGGLYMRRFLTDTTIDSITIAAMQLVLATGLALIAAPFISTGPMQLTATVVAAISALGILGGGIAYILYTGIIRTWGPARASTVTYLTPVVGVTLGALFLGETVHWNEPVGGAIVVLGILASQGAIERWIDRGARSKPADEPACEAATPPESRLPAA